MKGRQEESIVDSLNEQQAEAQTELQHDGWKEFETPSRSQFTFNLLTN